MSEIRPFERRDAAAVAELYELTMRSGAANPPPGLQAYLERTLFVHPWVDEDIPSLVYTGSDGAVLGFQGSSVRRARLDRRPVRIACAGQLVVHPDARHRGAGARLVRAYLDGPQDLTITDTASDQMRQIWMLLGGEMVHLGCIAWVRVLRPWRAAESFIREHRLGWRRPAGRGVLSMLDAATVKCVGRRIAAPVAPEATSEPLTPSAIVQNLELLGARFRLRLDYDEQYLGWLFERLGVVQGLGTPVARLVRAPCGRVLGWYVYYLFPGGTSRVLQIAAADRDVGSVFDHLMHDAWLGGAAALTGRVEPQLLTPLGHRRCAMHYAPVAALAHSRDAEILSAIATGDGFLTRLDGDWWMQDKLVHLQDAA